MGKFDQQVKGMCLACALCTIFVIYLPMWVSGTPGIAIIGAPNFAKDDALRMSYVSIMAGASSMVLDFILDVSSIIAGTTKRSSGRLASRVLLLFVLYWPSLHLFFWPQIGIASFVYDALLQRYVCLTLITVFLQSLDKDYRWSWYIVAGIIGCASTGSVLFTMHIHYGLSEGGFLASKIFMLLSAFGIFCCGALNFWKSEHRFVLAILVSVYLGLVLVLVISQSAMKLHQWSVVRDMKLAANYFVVAACTVPVVMPVRVERERAQCAEKANEFRQSFVRYISHEIRTPMNVATVGVAIAEDFLRGNGLFMGEIGEIIDQTKRALTISTEILNDMLTFEKLNANAMILEQTLERPIEFVRAAAEIFEFQARDKGLHFLLPCSSTVLGDAYIFIDTYKMSQVIRNLISNALKFTPGGGTIVVDCEAVSKAPKAANSNNNRDKTAPIAEWLKISVADDGAGIALENIGKLFKGIIQFDANKLQGGKGTGLGMFISCGIVELHGGTLTVQSDGLGCGCTFTVELPLIRANASIHSPERKNVISSTANDGSSEGSVGYESARGGAPGPTQDHSLHSLEKLEAGLISANPCSVHRSPGSAAAMDEMLPADRSEHVGTDQQEKLPRSSKWESSRPRKNAYEMLKDVESGKNLNFHHTPQFSTIDLRDCHVLLVDDSPMTLKMMSLMIKKFGAECITADDGSVAVQLVKDSMCGTGPRIDIVVMDNNMGIMNGPQACRLMRESGFSNPIFELTGDTDEKSDEEYIGAGATQILRKPLKLKEIVDALTYYSI
jgi:signal transduction histidine kinase/CheY-like chemotaxis protein